MKAMKFFILLMKSKIVTPSMPEDISQGLNPRCAMRVYCPRVPVILELPEPHQGKYEEEKERVGWEAVLIYTNFRQARHGCSTHWAQPSFEFGDWARVCAVCLWLEVAGSRRASDELRLRDQGSPHVAAKRRDEDRTTPEPRPGRQLESELVDRRNAWEFIAGCFAFSGTVNPFESITNGPTEATVRGNGHPDTVIQGHGDASPCTKAELEDVLHTRKR